MIISVDTSEKKNELARRAKELRDEVAESNLDLFGATWQVDAKSRGHMRETIETARRIGAADTDSREWILANNTTRPTTVADLEAVLNAYTLRLGEVFRQYNSWRSGSKSRPFTPEGI